MANLLHNSYKIPKTRLNYSRSIFNYKRTHTTNMLTGLITPVGFFNLKPGDTPPKNFGFVLQSAPLLGPSMDNVYIDIITVWIPERLVFANHNEWLGDSDTFAWTLNQSVLKPKITKLETGKSAGGDIRSLSYYAEHYRAPHFGCRWYDQANQLTDFTANTVHGAGSRFKDGISVIPFRMYDLVYNKLFRNQNIINPILFSKQAGTDLSLDVTNYQIGGGELYRASRLKNMFTTCRIGPSVDTVDILSGISTPVRPGSSEHTTDGSVYELIWRYNYLGSQINGTHNLQVGTSSTNILSTTVSGGSPVYPTNLYAELSGLTVNSLYYSIMLQRFFNKASTGRRPVEFYQEFFGIESSEVGHDDPQLLSQKRFKVDITRVVSTAAAKDGQGNDQALGTQGAYSLTVGSGSLFPDFTATEYGMIHIYAVIRDQESIATGVDRYFSDSDLLSTYLPTFDHIGDDLVEAREFSNALLPNTTYAFGYNMAWYHDRMWNNDVTGIVAPGQPLEYFTLARAWNSFSTPFGINQDFIEQDPHEFDRMLQFPVCYAIPGASGIDIDGEPYNSNRYQWIIQFAVVGDFSRTMSKNSEQLMF